MKFKNYLFILFAVCLAIGCEDLEDTYSDYAGDGAIRYLGSAENLSIHPGWKRLLVKWTNSVDPAIDHIKLQWNLNGVTKDTILARDVTECNLKNLKDGNYEISIFGVDKNGATSLAQPLYGRPYTEEHEAIRSFTQVVAKHVCIGDRLILFFSDWQSNVDSVSLNYYTPEGKLAHFELDSVFVTKNKYCLFEYPVDPSKEISIYRRGRVEGCEELIVFAPYIFTNEKLYTTDFKQWVKEKYGRTEITEEWINSLEDFEYDYDVNSFEDLLNIPNLKTLTLGKNRYMDVSRGDSIYSTLIDKERSVFTLNTLSLLNGLSVDRYSKHYFTDDVLPDYVKEKGNTNTPPAVSFFVGKQWVYECSEEDAPGYNSRLMFLFDGSSRTNWVPEKKSQARTYVIEVDMLEQKTVTGVRVLQSAFSNSNNSEYYALMPDVIKIECSVDRLSWQAATHVEVNTIGNSNGESTYLDFKEKSNVRYLRFTIYDQPFGSNFGVRLAGIDVY